MRKVWIGVAVAIAATLGMIAKTVSAYRAPYNPPAFCYVPFETFKDEHGNVDTTGVMSDTMSQPCRTQKHFKDV